MSDGWQNVQEHCLLCEMEKRTKWYRETDNWLVAEKLGGGPFVVSKTHQKELSEAEAEGMREVVGEVFDDDVEIVVKMNLVRDHWHGHIMTSGEPVDLSAE